MSRKPDRPIDGVIGIWKPAGWTSHDVVAKARRILGVRRIGHTGTLDPAVTGVLPICIGRATRFVEYLQEMPKTYEAVLRFGLATDTEDLSGEVVEHRDASFLKEDEIAAAARSFLGDIDQVPPMASAVKIGGKRLYELARQGVTIERPSRRVSIYSLEIRGIRTGTDQPELSFAVTCSKGTYIRTLCVDIGRKLGVPAVMALLERTESAGIGRERCLTLDRLAELDEAELKRWLIVPDKMLLDMPALTADSPESEHALQGKSLPAARLQPPPLEEGLCRLYRTDGAFLGLFTTDKELETVRPVKVFHPLPAGGSDEGESE